MEGSGIEPPPQAFQARTLPLSYPFVVFMRRISLFKLIKKIKHYSHISIFFNNRLEKPIRYGYRYIQRAFREPKRLKFLKIQVRQPRLPVRRKTRYGKRLELRQKAIYSINFGRLKKLVSYNNSFNKAGSFSRFSRFVAHNFFMPSSYLHVFGFSESPAFNFFSSRYIRQLGEINNYSATFIKSFPGTFFFPISGFFYLYAIRVFFYRLFIKSLRFFLIDTSFFFNFKLFSFYPFSTALNKPSSFRRAFDNRFTQFSFGRLRLLLVYQTWYITYSLIFLKRG